MIWINNTLEPLQRKIFALGQTSHSEACTQKIWGFIKTFAILPRFQLPVKKKSVFHRFHNKFLDLKKIIIVKRSILQTNEVKKH
ncbi:MAG: hypothetical protein ACMUEM_05040 [Flavobacteriales bacterium AspAUS03]